MREVVGRLQPLLRRHGFRKQRHAFARDLAQGLTHAVVFEMGRCEPHPDRQPGPYYGSFRVECGVHVDAVGELYGDPKPRFVRPADCHLRTWAGALLSGEDSWWTLDQPVEDLAEGMTQPLAEVIRPWLDGLVSIDAIVEARQHGRLGGVLASEVTFGLLDYARGDRAPAARTLRSELARTQNRRAAERIVALGRRLGLGLSMDDAAIVTLLAAERDPREPGG